MSLLSLGSVGLAAPSPRDCQARRGEVVAVLPPPALSKGGFVPSGKQVWAGICPARRRRKPRPRLGSQKRCLGRRPGRAPPANQRETDASAAGGRKTRTWWGWRNREAGTGGQPRGRKEGSDEEERRPDQQEERTWGEAQAGAAQAGPSTGAAAILCSREEEAEAGPGGHPPSGGDESWPRSPSAPREGGEQVRGQSEASRAGRTRGGGGGWRVPRLPRGLTQESPLGQGEARW